MSKFTRRGLIKTSSTVGAGLAMPTFITSPLAAYTNAPTGGSVTLGFTFHNLVHMRTRVRMNCAHTNLLLSILMVVAMVE